MSECCVNRIRMGLRECTLKERATRDNADTVGENEKE